MQKIPTLFHRDPANMRYVTSDVNHECQWVIDGEGTATRKYDGTCVALLYTDGEQVSLTPLAGDPNMTHLAWFARREVKPGKTRPQHYVPISTDPNTGKTVGWEPIEQSPFARFHAEAIARDAATVNTDGVPGHLPGTYELCGKKINGDPELVGDGHLLIRHETADVLHEAPRDFDGLKRWLPLFGGEGIVWHHPDGRMAKLKRRDFPPA